jgi:hypothetical protein
MAFPVRAASLDREIERRRYLGEAPGGIRKKKSLAALTHSHAVSARLASEIIIMR